MVPPVHSSILSRDRLSQGEEVASSSSSSNVPVDWDVSYAGFVRYFFSSLLRRSSTVIRRGVRVRPRSFAHSTDRLKELVEFREHYLSAHEGGGHDVHTTTAPQTSAPPVTEKKLSRFRDVAKEVFPGFLKHVGFATLVFSSYETLYDDYYLQFQANQSHSPEVFDVRNKATSLLGPLLCGSLVGAFGGTYYITWDLLASRWHKLRHDSSSQQLHYPPISIRSVIFSHTMTQGSLFSSYEFMKWTLTQTRFHEKLSVLCTRYLPTWISLDHGDPSPHSINSPSKFSAFKHHDYPNSFSADLLSIMLCGGIAGAISETVQHWMKLYDFQQRDPAQKQELYNLLKEQLGLRQRVRNYLHIFLPGGHSLINAAIPMSLAFLAYEYGKETLGEHHHHLHNG